MNLNPADYTLEKSELGVVYLPKKGVTYAETVKLSLVKIMWMQKITVTGVYAAQ